MGAMNQKNLLWLSQSLEREARSALARDASFLEVLQCLKWQIDNDAHVKAAVRALQDRGLSVFTSFAPRIRIRLAAGETILALPGSGAASNAPNPADQVSVNRLACEPLVQKVRDAASAVVAASPHCRQLHGIVSEAVQANSRFERIAVAVERAGYRVQICLDLSAYAQVREPGRTPEGLHDFRISPLQESNSRPPDSRKGCHLPLSSRDLQFLKELRIQP